MTAYEPPYPAPFGYRWYLARGEIAPYWKLERINKYSVRGSM